jgi:catechol 2,3-dioxygenase-like lactoylglutathione lyase family enzyme
MFRQVIAYRWKDGVTEDDKAGFRGAFAGLREIPEVTGLRFADDARHFEGNFDVVAVMDFPDFASARRYVADERHQAYIREYASQMIGERVVVQHDWAVGEVAGIHHVAGPVADLARSRDWYVRAFGFDVASESPDEVAMTHPTLELVLRHDPTRAAALAGFGTLTLAVSTASDLATIVAGLDATGVEHEPLTTTPEGAHVDLADPDGHVVRLRTLLA